MDTGILEQIGFSKSEVIVYVALLSCGQTKSGKIITKTGLQSSVVHNALNTLKEKGFASHILEGRIKKYIALDPKLISKYLDAKKREFELILPQLEALKNKSVDISSSEIYYGYNGLLAATLKMIESSKEKIWKYFVGKNQLYSKEDLKFFHKSDLIKKDRGLIVRGISEESGRKMMEGNKSKVKYTHLGVPPAMNIFGEFVLIFSLSDKPVGILINSKEISNQYHELWDRLWKTAKK